MAWCSRRGPRVPGPGARVPRPQAPLAIGALPGRDWCACACRIHPAAGCLSALTWLCSLNLFIVLPPCCATTITLKYFPIPQAHMQASVEITVTPVTKFIWKRGGSSAGRRRGIVACERFCQLIFRSEDHLSVVFPGYVGSLLRHFCVVGVAHPLLVRLPGLLEWRVYPITLHGVCFWFLL